MHKEHGIEAIPWNMAKLLFIEGKLKDLSGIFTKKAARIVRTILWLMLTKDMKNRAEIRKYREAPQLNQGHPVG